MSKTDKSIEVNVPISTAYNQWTQFESFPKFMEGVESVTQLDDKHLRWIAEIGGKKEEWTAEIDKQIPDKRIAWHSTSGAQNTGVVTFDYMDPNTTRVTLQIDYEPQGVIENIGSLLGIVSARVKGDLERFKDFIESQQKETGAWRGEISGDSASQSETRS